MGARLLQSFCSKYGPAPVINVVEDLFSQHFFFEGSVLTVSAGDSRVVDMGGELSKRQGVLFDCWPFS